jgi:Alpha/beta hydrolase domain
MLGDSERGDNPDYRVIELAGVSHIPASIFDLRNNGYSRQNPVSYAPPLRAALVNLQEWVNGKEPPPSAPIELSDALAKESGVLRAGA